MIAVDAMKMPIMHVIDMITMFYSLTTTCVAVLVLVVVMNITGITHGVLSLRPCRCHIANLPGCLSDLERAV